MEVASAKKDNEPDGLLARLALRFTDFAERWFPDAFVFVAVAVGIVATGALINGAKPMAIATAFGDGSWGLIVFTLPVAWVGGWRISPRPLINPAYDSTTTSSGASCPRRTRARICICCPTCRSFGSERSTRAMRTCGQLAAMRSFQAARLRARRESSAINAA